MNLLHSRQLKSMMEIKRGKYTIQISETVLLVLEKYKQDKKGNESGGIILGQVIDNNCINITKLSLPNTFDKSSRYSFDRDKIIAQIIVDYEFSNTVGKTIYLGEWHTHPEKNPTPSHIDRSMFKQQFKENKINESFLIFFIKGIENLYVGIYDGKVLIDK
jgi:integrative and conjugative element protein (TIGR02256 family)